MRTFGFAATLTLWLVSISLAQELSTEVFPSEDELLEALRLSEIDIYQFLILQEIILHGIDSASSHLLDEIPNLAFFVTQPQSPTTSLETEQTTPFAKPDVKIKTVGGTFRHQFYQELEQQEQSRYRTTCHLNFRNNLEAAFKLHREFSGRERFVSRRFSYHNDHGKLHKVTLGNFSARLGLGTVFGYRGKLLGFSDRIGKESLLFPDYGGYNGVFSQLNLNQVEVKMLSSVNRDSSHMLISTGGMVSWKAAPFEPAVIAGVNHLKNRSSGKNLNDFKYGLYSMYRYSTGYLSLEFSAQAGDRSSWGAVVAEGRHLFGLAEIKYAAWIYNDNYLDLSGGSKAGNLRHQITLDDVDLTFSDKRSGQEGGMLKSIVQLNEKLQWVNSLTYAGRNKDTLDFQFLSALINKINLSFEFRLDYLNKTKRRISTVQRDLMEQRTRLEARFKAGDLFARSYIAYNTENGRSDDVAFFLNVRYRLVHGGLVEIWSNLAHFDLEDTAIDYWYMYVRNEQPLFPGMTAAIKMSHRYDRNAGEKHYTVISLEVNTTL
ncbi:MAG: hypothetical protein ACE5K8_01715 [Candidatus Zixiibacteriota bacterium]